MYTCLGCKIICGATKWEPNEFPGEYMIDIVVTVTGPGGCINFETIIIQRALEAVGITVVVEDECPLHSRNTDSPQSYPKETEDEYVDRITEIIKTENHPITVKLIAEHCPWGG